MNAHDNLPGAADGDNSQEAGADYASLLGEADGLDIPDPDELEADAADAEADGEADSDEADEQDAKGISDDATIQLDGREVSVKELKETFSTFQRKAQEYALQDSEREVQARNAIATVQEEAAQRVAVMAQSINDLVLPGIDMQTIARLRLEDPAKAGELLTNLQIVERWKTDMMAKAQELWGTAQKQREEAEKKQLSSQSELLREEAEKLSRHKWFNDDFKNRARSYLKSHGIPDQFVAQISYAGALEIINKAMAYDKAKSSIKSGKQPSQTAQVPASGKPREATNRQRADQAFAEARKSGSRRAVARAYSSLLGG